MIEIIVFLIGFTLLIQLYFSSKSRKRTGDKPILAILLGSGGHTTEMCSFLRNFDFLNVQQIYIISTSTDKLSNSFFLNFMNEERPEVSLDKFIFLQTKRTNEVKQSMVTSILSTLLAAFNALWIILRKAKGVTHLVGNGPGFCVPFFYLYFIFNKVKLTSTKTIFIESWCRVDSLSSSGKLIKLVSDEFLIHWEGQKKLYSNARY